MSIKFDQAVCRMPILLEALKSQPFLTRDNLANVPDQGAYVFFEDNKPIYVGRSRKLKRRLKEHSQISSHYSATLAIKIAKKNTPTLQKKERKQTKEQLMKNGDFVKEFEAAKVRIAGAKIRCVKIKDPIEQAMFEIYAHLELGTEFNDFNTT